jgi:hypothetical protein
MRCTIAPPKQNQVLAEASHAAHVAWCELLAPRNLEPTVRVHGVPAPFGVRMNHEESSVTAKSSRYGQDTNMGEAGRSDAITESEHLTMYIIARALLGDDFAGTWAKNFTRRGMTSSSGLRAKCGYHP